MSVHGIRISIAVGEIIWLVVAMGGLAIGALVFAFFADNASISADRASEESDTEQGAFDDPHSEEYTS